MAAEDTLVEETNESTESTKRTRARKPEVEALTGKKVKLTIHKDPSPTAVDPVFVGLNFVGYSIKRGEEVIVPAELVEVLKSSAEVRYEQKGDQLIIREVPSYAFSVMPV
jgi:hypothetical protein